MTDEQRKRIHDITYSTDDRMELAERIVGLEDELERAEQLLGKRKYDIEKLYELITCLQDNWESELDYADQMEDKEKKLVAENAKLRELVQKWYPHMVRRVGKDALAQWGQFDVLRKLGIEVDE